MTAPKGCLTAAVLAALAGWSLLVGSVLAFGWMGTEIVGAVVGLLFGDAEAARRGFEDVTAFLRTLGFGVLATIWAVGAACLALLWFVLARVVASLPERRDPFERRDPPFAMPRPMKDVTPTQPTLRPTLPPPDRGPSGPTSP